MARVWEEVIAIRHGESVANAAAARAGGVPSLIVIGPDRDVPLTPRGRRQAVAVGRWLALLPADRSPTVVYRSPYLRAAETTRLALAESGTMRPVVADPRLADRSMGEYELLPAAVIADRFPEAARRRRAEGALDWRPPRGESLRDVAARVNNFLTDLSAASHAGGCGSVLIVAHDAVILAMRRVWEGLTDRQWLDVVANDPPGNAAVTRWVAAQGRWRLERYNDAPHHD